MAHYQNNQRVNVEFLKSAKGIGSRVIKLNYVSVQVPQQLYGRVDLVPPLPHTQPPTRRFHGMKSREIHYFKVPRAELIHTVYWPLINRWVGCIDSCPGGW